MNNGLSYQVSQASLALQGGVRRAVLIFALICLVLLAPVYFAGQFGANFWANSDLNNKAFDGRTLVNEKLVVENKFSIDRTQSVPLLGNETVLYTTINNKNNPTIGYYPFVYRLQVLDDNGSLLTESIERDYLLPGEIKYVMVSSTDTTGKEIVVTPLDETKPTTFDPTKDALAQTINLEVRNPLVRDNNDSDTIELEAFVKNLDLLVIRELDLLYIIRDSRDRVIGIGEYKMKNLEPGDEKKLSLTYPKSRFRRATRLEIRPFVNYLKEGNVILDGLDK